MSLVSSSNPTLINSILWSNFYSPPEIDLISSTINISYSNIKGGWEGEGNIDLNPLFVDPSNGDYSLQSGSPCIDAGNPSSEYNDTDGSRNDMGAYGGPKGSW